MVDDLVGPRRPRTLGAARGGRGDHVCAGPLGQLHRVAADRAAGAVDQHALPLLEPGVVEERLPRSQADHRQRRGVRERDVRGRRRQDLGRRDDELRGRTRGGHRQEGDDRVADRDVLDALAERVDRAGDVDARRVGQRHRERALQVAAADAGVDGVERRRGDADAHLAGAGDGLLDVLVAQHVGIAVLVKSHCLHLEPRFM